MARFKLRSAVALLAVAATLGFTMLADAAPRFNAGSRGTRTFSAPPPTATSPNAARPVERSMTQPGQPGSTVNRPATANPAAQTGGGFFRPGTMLGGLAAGFLGAGLFGMLFGGGFLAGLGSFAGFLGLLAQILLIVIIARLAWAWWQRRSQPAAAYAGANRDMHGEAGSRPSQLFPGLGSGSTFDNRPIMIKPEDYDAFERTLEDVQAAYSNEDVNKLGDLVTPEMLSYYAEELAANASRGVRNELADVKLLQGDLAEAWSEGERDYASVAMRYAITDRYIDRATSKVVEGETPQEVTEVWTFMRVRGGSWLLSAIQQTA